MAISNSTRKLAARSHRICGAVAIIMCLVAGGYGALAIFDRDTAKSIWWIYAVVEVVLALWNLTVYSAKTKVRDERQRHAG